MEQQQQLIRRTSEDHQESAVSDSLLPLESSPYLKYTDLVDYKQNAYGTHGHLQVKPRQGGGATKGPTLSGSNSAVQKALSDHTAWKTIASLCILCFHFN
ncbi:hypothetical protein K2173_027813 [Erythroxylum novogranatense]|uniref:Uncharacterized protein n=1 Tax=Erythroxylum novogranatense TaxID=1862640 RepID=A0AAV8U1F0_9ROSI|nr:hypothetical protein K2173_027813 [Erythroxylum novogranatense]